MTTSRRPNVMFIIVDQMKWSALRMYSEIGVETPSLERLAREGVRFEYAVTPHPLCVPARTSLMTARYPHSTGCRRNETLMPEDELHAFRIWKEMGFTTGLIGKNHCYVAPSDLDLFDVRCELSHRGLPRTDGGETVYLGEVPGRTGMEWAVPEDVIWESHATRRDMPVQSPVVSYAVTDHPLEGYSSSAITTQVEAFLERFAGGDTFGSGRDALNERQPFALMVSYPDPHTPLEIPRKYAELVPPESVRVPPLRNGEFDGPEVPERNRVLYEMIGLNEDSEEDKRGATAVYLAMCRFLDDAVGRIMDKLDDLGLRDDTIIVFTADHGDFAWEHNMLGKGGVFYDCLVRVPLIVSWPGGGVPSGAVDDSLVNTIDILPTLLQLGGIAEFTASPSKGPEEEVVPPGPRMLAEEDSPAVTSETLRRLQGKPLPTVTGAAPRAAAFSEYGAGGPPVTMEMMKSLRQPHGVAGIMDTLWAREAEGRRKMVRTRRWKYVTDPDLTRANEQGGGSGALQDDELYDLEADPWELTNVAHDPANAAAISEMRAYLAEWMISTEDASPVPLPTALGRGSYEAAVEASSGKPARSPSA